jgi:hypothetical protein
MTTRRRLLVGLSSVAAATVAGCSGSEDADLTDGAPAQTGDASSPDRETTAATEAATETGTAGDSESLDLREANVVTVAFEAQGDDEYRFDVTLYHDDEGEEGYANWWQVESTDGDRLGRRELLHAHGTREFTRSATVSVPDGTTCVVVRGHDQTHAYGGQAIVVNLATGATTAVRQGPDPDTDVADGVC